MNAFEIAFEILKILFYLGACVIISIDFINSILGRKTKLYEDIYNLFNGYSEKEEEKDDKDDGDNRLDC